MTRSDCPPKTHETTTATAQVEVGHKVVAHSMALTAYISFKLLPQQLQRINKEPTCKGLTVERVEAEAAPDVDEVKVTEVESHLLFVEE